MSWYRRAPWRGRLARAAALAAVGAALCGCFAARPSRGGGQIGMAPAPGGRVIDPRDIALPAGYRVEVVAVGLTFPTGVAFDDGGIAHVVEAGYSYGEVFTAPRLLRIEPGGEISVVATGERPPWNGVTFHGGAFYVAAGGVREGGQIIRVGRDGSISTVVDGLPSVGDHHANSPVVGPDGMLYFGVGTATNSGVVGVDNHEYGWLARFPDFHDIPCRDITLSGRNYVTANPLTPEDGDGAVTGAFSPFNTRTEPGQRVAGRLPCTGAILRVPVSGGALELVAWGFRNPYGLAFAPDGRLFVTENGYDVRGSRPVFGTADYLYEVRPGAWYGWPDYSGGVPIEGDAFQPSGATEPPGRLLAERPERPPRPAAAFGVHSSSNRLDFSRSPAFGHVGEAFVAQFGDMAPKVGKVLAPVGFKVVRVNPRTGVIHDFAANRGSKNGPASWIGGGGLERPVDARFAPDGEALYIVDFGVMKVSEREVVPVPRTGVLWRIARIDAEGEDEE